MAGRVRARWAPAGRRRRLARRAPWRQCLRRKAPRGEAGSSATARRRRSMAGHAPAQQFVATPLGFTRKRADLRALVGGAGAGQLVEMTLQVGKGRCRPAVEPVERLVDVDEAVGTASQELRLKLAKFFVPGAHLSVKPAASYHRTLVRRRRMPAQAQPCAHLAGQVPVSGLHAMAIWNARRRRRGRGRLLIACRGPRRSVRRASRNWSRSPPKRRPRSRWRRCPRPGAAGRSGSSVAAGSPAGSGCPVSALAVVWRLSRRSAGEPDAVAAQVGFGRRQRRLSSRWACPAGARAGWLASAAGRRGWS